jgi:hypothetical protein
MAAIVGLGCSDNPDRARPAPQAAAPQPAAQAPARTTASRRAATAAAPAPVCSPTGAHAAHQGSFFTCQVCHPCGGVIGIGSNITLPGGTPVTGTIAKDPATGVASCTVTCHGSQSVSWNAGPLGCSNCHGQWQSGAASVRSSHAIDPNLGLGANTPVCLGCHNTANHFDPNMALVTAGGAQQFPIATLTDAQVNTFCKSCHSPTPPATGNAIAGQTPPVLLGYDSAGAGDFHGARAGTGFGGTLAAPYTVGQPALACTACHDPHASTNAFLFAPTVNGNAVAAGSVDRAGVGADGLCQSCHIGDRHAGCKASGCHDGVSVVNGQVMSHEPVGPTAPCFFCHGHEGIVNFQMPTWDNHPNGTGNYCSHCHASGWLPPVEYVAPGIVGSITVAGVTATTATIIWDTNELATSYVEFGTTDPITIQGDATLVTHHTVTLTGLVQGTTYNFKVRSSDGFRNLTESPATPLTFTTAMPLPPNTPATPNPLHPSGPADEVAVDCTAGCASTINTTLRWSAVPSPDGSPITYRVVLSTSPTFAGAPLVDRTVSTTSLAVPGLNLPVDGYPTLLYYYWRVMAIDVGAGTSSGWSTTATFDAYWWMM